MDAAVRLADEALTTALSGRRPTGGRRAHPCRHGALRARPHDQRDRRHAGSAALAHRSGLLKGVLRATVSLVAVQTGVGRLDGAIGDGKEGLRLAGHLGRRRPYEAPLDAQFALAHVRRGLPEQAEEILDNAPTITGDQYRWHVEVVRAELELVRGELQAARRAIENTRLEAGTHLMWALRRSAVASEVALAEGEAGEARAAASELLDLAELWPDSTMLRLAALGIGAMALAGDWADADEWLDRAEAKATQLQEELEEAPVDVAAWLAAVRAQHEAATGSEASRWWQEAADRFAEARFDGRHAWAMNMVASTHPMADAVEPADGSRPAGRRSFASATSRSTSSSSSCARRRERGGRAPGLRRAPAPPPRPGSGGHQGGSPLRPGGGDRFVSESALTSRITGRPAGGRGRRALPPIIKTVHGRGYRFVADVSEVADRSPTALAGAAATDPHARSAGFSIAYQISWATGRVHRLRARLRVERRPPVGVATHGRVLPPAGRRQPADHLR